MNAPRRAGSLLIMTLWMVAVLTVLSVTIARHLSLEIRLTKNRLALEQARILARNGVYLAMQRLSRDQQESDGRSYDWLGDDWAYIPPTHPDDDPTRWVVPFPADDGDTEMRFAGYLTVQIRDEERKLPLNTATPATLRGWRRPLWTPSMHRIRLKTAPTAPRHILPRTARSSATKSCWTYPT